MGLQTTPRTYSTNVNNAINTNCVYAFWKIHGQCSAAELSWAEADSHHESDGILSQKCFSLDKISDLLPLSWNRGHVNLNTAAASLGKQNFSEWLWVAKTAPGRISLEEARATTDMKHDSGVFRLDFHAARPLVDNSLNWVISWLSLLFFISVDRTEIYFQKKINFNFWTHLKGHCLCLKSKRENITSIRNVASTHSKL